MALNGSGFGASSTLDDEYYQEKTSGSQQHDPYSAPNQPYDLETDYTSYPPPVQPNLSNAGAYDQDSDDDINRDDGHGGTRAGGGDGSGHVTYPVYR